MIIGLIGYKQSGKSTAAQHLAKKYGYIRHNFKDALIAEIKQNFPDLLEAILDATRESGEYFYAPSGDVSELFKTKPPLVRALMQNYGTEVRRKDNDDYWVHEWVVNCFKKPKVIADDVRFLNEAKAVRGMNGILIRIIRTDIDSGGTHASETEQDQIKTDYTITVDKGEHDKLYSELDKIIDETNRL